MKFGSFWFSWNHAFKVKYCTPIDYIVSSVWIGILRQNLAYLLQFFFLCVSVRLVAKYHTMEERSNLMNMMKLSIKVLIQSALSLGRTLDSDFPPLQQFFVVMEHCLKHGLKGEGFFFSI